MSDESVLLAADDPRVSRALEAFAAIGGWLEILNNMAERSGRESNDIWIARSLLDSSRCAFQHLRRAWRSDSTYIAWACRNLIELRVFSKYVVQSEGNRQRFLEDLAVDSIGSEKALGQFMEALSLTSTIDPDNVAGLKDANTALQNAGKQHKTYLSPMKLISELGIGVEYAAVHKMCSKLVHPTVQSILGMHKSYQAERDLFLLMGGNCLHDIMDDVCPFVEALHDGCAL